MEFYLAQHKYICNLQSNLTQLRKTQFKQPHITNSYNKMASKWDAAYINEWEFSVQK